MPSEPNKYRFNHTSIRVKDPERSIKFYNEVLGMKLIMSAPIETDNFTLHFMGYVDTVPEDVEEKKRLVLTSTGILELKHVWGTENKADFAYANGNDEKGLGYGHIALVVDDLEESCKRLGSLGVNFVERLEDGNLNFLAYISDPDGYHIEILQNPIFTGKNPF